MYSKRWFHQGCSQRASGRCCTSQYFTSTSRQICTAYILGQFQTSCQLISNLEMHCSSCLCTKIIKFWRLHIKTTLVPCFADWRSVYGTEHLPGILRTSRNLFSGYIPVSDIIVKYSPALLAFQMEICEWIPSRHKFGTPMYTPKTVVWNRRNTVFPFVNVLTIFAKYFRRRLWVWRLTNILTLSLPCCTQYCVKTDRVINEYQQYIHKYLRCMYHIQTWHRPIYLAPSFHLIRFISVFHDEVQNMWMLCVSHVSKGYPCKRIGYKMFYLRSVKCPTG